MAIAPTLLKYLADQQVTYEVISHERTTTSLGTVKTSGILAECFAKGILLKDVQGYWLAVLRASRHASLSDLRTDLGDPVRLAGEEEVAEVFRDCVRGAIPPFGECYGLDVIIDSSIDQQPELCCEGGDHATLVRLDQAEFARLNGQARHGSFAIRE